MFLFLMTSQFFIVRDSNFRELLVIFYVNFDRVSSDVDPLFDYRAPTPNWLT